MIQRLFLAVCSILLCAALCLAADLNGRWEGAINGPNGEIKLVFTLKVEGDKLTGTVESPRGERPITDGKVKGDEFSFKVTAGDNVITYLGKVAGETLNVKVQGPWGEGEMTLKRAAAK